VRKDLLELAGAEGEVAGRDLVAEGLAHLGHAERQLAPRGLQDVEEIDEDALGGFGPQVGESGLVLHRPDMGPEHAVEHPRRGQLAPALRACFF